MHVTNVNSIICDGRCRSSKDGCITSVSLHLTLRFFSWSFQNVFLKEEGVLGLRRSMPFQTCEIPQLRGQYFDMLLTMFYVETYLTDGVAGPKIVELPLTLSCSCGCGSRGLPLEQQLQGRSFGGRALHAISNM